MTGEDAIDARLVMPETQRREYLAHVSSKACTGMSVLRYLLCRVRQLVDHLTQNLLCFATRWQ